MPIPGQLPAPTDNLAANCWGWSFRATQFFAGWLVKVVITRYGGLRLYRQTVPIAVGLIVGNMLNTGAWAVVTLATQGRF
jgi:hypothetical protein